MPATGCVAVVKLWRFTNFECVHSQRFVVLSQFCERFALGRGGPAYRQARSYTEDRQWLLGEGNPAFVQAYLAAQDICSETELKHALG